MAGLKCEVGYSNETQIMECEGSWEKVQMMMKEEMGNKWQMIQQNMDLSGLVDDLKSKVDDLKDVLKDVLKTTGDGRRKREAGEESSAEPEPEPEPSEEYFCIKKSLGGTTVKSCLPKVMQVLSDDDISPGGVSVSGRPPEHGLQCDPWDGDSLCL